MSKKRVAVALSGGVDSSVAAYLLKNCGYDIIGLHLLLSDPEYKCLQDGSELHQGSINDIQEFCRIIDIPLEILDLRSEFKLNVIDYFCREYEMGRTPNPCVICNQKIKFGILFDKLYSLGVDYLATGHYASVAYYDNCFHLLKAKDLLKDQSYMLYRLNQDRLGKIIFPLANIYKKDVYKIAWQNKFTSAKHRSSQDICFIKNGKYTDFLKGFVRPLPGEIVDQSGRILGKHKGLIYYTIGQRYGLGISHSKKLYVINIDYKLNRVVVGYEEELYHSQLIARELHWTTGKFTKENEEVNVKIRYKSPEATAVIHIENELVRVLFKERQRAITPGQAVVFYQENEVIGGGTIEAWEM